MQPPFDFAYTLYMHSGLEGWILVEGKPETFMDGIPVKFIRPGDATSNPQQAVFDYVDGTVNLSMGDTESSALTPRIVGLEMAYMQILYRGGSDGNRDSTSQSA